MAFGYSYGLPFSARYPKVDPDAQAFLTVTGITDPVIVNAINNLVVDLKTGSLWTKMEVIYPFVGGTADTHKYNLKNPVDSDAAYRIGWTPGGVTHNANGITGNGISGAGNTFYSITRQNDLHLCVYIRNNAQSRCAIGALSTTTFPITQLYPRQAGGLANQAEGNINQGASSLSAATITDSRGNYITSRRVAGTVTTDLNATQIINSSQASTGVPDRPLAILGRKTAAFAEYSTYNIAFASIGNGLTAGERTTLRTIVTAFETALSRAV